MRSKWLELPILPTHNYITIMPTFEHEFKNESWNGKVCFPTGIFIDGKFQDGSDGKLIE